MRVSRVVAASVMGLVGLVATVGCGSAGGGADAPTSAPTTVVSDTTVAVTVAPTTATPTAPAPSAPAPTTVVPTPAPTTAPPPTTPAPPAGPVATVRWVLGGIAVKGRAPNTGYSRAQFGPAWTDDVAVAGGHNGCDTRNDILRRDLTGITVKPGTRNCVVLTGTLWDPYTGRHIAFTRGRSTSTAVQIDHVVALNDAWQTGAQQIGPERRRMLANDPMNLVAVDGPTNMGKGAGDAATWLPPNKSYRCRYVAVQTMVKARYHLWMTAAEHEAVARILGRCTDAQIGFIG